jgi:hypothetical protein
MANAFRGRLYRMDNRRNRLQNKPTSPLPGHYIWPCDHIGEKRELSRQPAFERARQYFDACL